MHEMGVLNSPLSECEVAANEDLGAGLEVTVYSLLADQFLNLTALTKLRTTSARLRGYKVLRPCFQIPDLRLNLDLPYTQLTNHIVYINQIFYIGGLILPNIRVLGINFASSP